MDYYEDYEAYATVYEDNTYDIDKDIEDMLSYDPNWYKEDFERAFGKGEQHEQR